MHSMNRQKLEKSKFVSSFENLYRGVILYIFRFLSLQDFFLLKCVSKSGDLNNVLTQKMNNFDQPIILPSDDCSDMMMSIAKHCVNVTHLAGNPRISNII
eukprot:TRINITY_DN4551_c0_g1_i1.p1 TRINITY_DN4551_c0_g1~~TRINITY_DN4551_c0_g1_i1.p1  ORF type:complete len:100 (-),score=9.75 TRINITY_DN4551_c0_g1_i1:145-444(-)